MDKSIDTKRSRINNFFHDIFFMYFCVPLILLVFVCALSLIYTKKQNGVPMVFGYSLMTITSESMEDVGFFVGDKIIIKKNTSKHYKKGDYIAFFDYADPECSYYTDVTQINKPRKHPEINKMVFHEIIEVFEDSNNEYWYRTKGTNNNHTDINLIYEGYVIGEYVFTSQNVNTIIKNVTSLRGTFAFIVLPCMMILFKDCMTLVSLIFDLIDEKKRHRV